MEYQYKQLSLYSDTKSSDLFILPNGSLPQSGPVEIEHLEHLAFPYNEDQLFEIIIATFNLCYTKVPPIPAKASSLALMLGAKNYKSASRNKKLVMITWQKNEGYKVYPTRKDKRYGYEHLINMAVSLGQNLEKRNLYVSIKNAMEQSYA